MPNRIKEPVGAADGSDDSPLTYRQAFEVLSGRLGRAAEFVKWATRLVVALILFAVAMTIGVVLLVSALRGVNAALNRVSEGDSPAAVTRRQYQAEQRFLTCEQLRVDHAPTYGLCDGYDTLAHAYASQHVEPPK